VSGYKGRRLTVLQVDDDLDHRELIGEILSPLGFILFMAEDGERGLELADECQPDLFILDISLPGISGWEVAARLRASGHEKTPILVVSAVAGGEEMSGLGAQYHDAHIKKPIRIDDLLDNIGKLLKIEWIDGLASPVDAVDKDAIRKEGARLPLEDIRELRERAGIGHVRAVQDKLSDISARFPELHNLSAEMRAMTERFELDELAALLQELECENAG
jgi:CheY-like chemotaxis protein